MLLPYAFAMTDAQLFVDKAQLFPGCTFLVGIDTAVRIVNPKYYSDSAEQMAAVLNAIRALGCDFLVACRVDSGTKHVQTLADADIPAGFQGMFTDLPGSRFREDISSSEIRQARAASATNAVGAKL